MFSPQPPILPCILTSTDARSPRIITGDTKAGTYIGSDRFGNKYYENMKDELPRKFQVCIVIIMAIRTLTAFISADTLGGLQGSLL